MPGFAPLRRRKRAPAREGRSQRAWRGGQSQELRRESHQFRSDLSQELRLGISRTLLRTGGQRPESQQFRPSDTGPAIQGPESTELRPKGRVNRRLGGLSSDRKATTTGMIHYKEEDVR